MYDGKIKFFNVIPALPKELEPLRELAYNLWFSWNPEAIKLFMMIDRKLWDEVERNPVLLLGRVSQNRLEALRKDDGFLMQLKRVYESLKIYLDSKKNYNFNLDKPIDFKIAYFSAEYGLVDALPIYSGGLGVLAGDHLKSSSDLNVPIVGIGLMYQYGYFRQYLNLDGWQQEKLVENDKHNMPVKLVRKKDGTPLKLKMLLGYEEIYIKVWRVKVGRNTLYLIDSNCKENTPEQRKITAQLYGGDIENRIKQEIILGIGGVKVLHRLEDNIKVYHMNEGHSAFASLERIKILMKENSLSFHEAKELVKATNIFTTHTPVPAGNDYFSPDLMKKYFERYVQDLGISMEEFLKLGRQNEYDANEYFGMTVLAMKLSSFRNGVSRLHGSVSRNLWKNIWPHIPKEDVPIDFITNGVHIPSWISIDIRELYDRYLGHKYFENPTNENIWERVDSIPDSELWRTHERRRERLVAFARRRLLKQLIDRGESMQAIDFAKEVLNPDALTIGFARRFATYKRAYLIFKDIERLKKILFDPEKPVQIIISGKAHPRDTEGKKIIKQIIDIARKPEFRYKIVFLEDYDMNVARYMVEGVDVWLNNPLRPMEACGTSGMKAAANGVINLSVLDGWWCEAYNKANGWAIGKGETYDNKDYQDEVESKMLYSLLENEVIPLFYKRHSDGVPHDWVRVMKNSLKTITGRFNSHRMLQNYVDKFYINAASHCDELTQNNFSNLRDLVIWKQHIYANWPNIKILDINWDHGQEEIMVGQEIDVKVKIFLGALKPEDIIMEIYYGRIDKNRNIVNSEVKAIENFNKVENEDGVYFYKGSLKIKETGRFGMKIRILPYHRYLYDNLSEKLILWG